MAWEKVAIKNNKGQKNQSNVKIIFFKLQTHIQNRCTALPHPVSKLKLISK